MWTNPCERKEGRKLGQDEPQTASARPPRVSLSEGHPQEESHVGQEWLSSDTPTMRSH